MKTSKKSRHQVTPAKYLVSAVFCAVLLISLPAFAKQDAEVNISASGIYAAGAAHITFLELRIADPTGQIIFQQSTNGEPLAWSVPAGAMDGRYSYEVRLGQEPKKEKRDDHQGQGPKTRAMIESGSFLIENDSVIQSTGEETSMLEHTLSLGRYAFSMVLDFIVAPAAADVLHADDVIITGSTCIGFDCLTDGSEAFGFDTLKFKENNLRIYADDTSSTVGFPANDWRIIFNDSASGGASYFAVEDSTAARVPFKIEAAAPTNSLYVDDYGRVGLGTSLPVLELHIADGDTPSVRLDQDGSGGWTPQVWDIAGNESNFFIRDTTGGSKLPFRIQPGAPTSTLTMKSDGKVGIGTWSPTQTLHVEGNAFINGNLELGSSREVKNNIRSLDADEALMTVAMLRPVKFQYKAAPEEETVGFIAEEVPDLVATNSRTSLSTMDIVAVLTKVVQDQQKAIEELNKTIVQLQEKVENNGVRQQASAQQ